jgi:hypothetical protein
MQKMNKVSQSVLVFCAVAVASFCMVLPRRASAFHSRTVPGIACVVTRAWSDGTRNYECPMDGGTDVGGLTTVVGGYYDYQTSPASKQVLLFIASYSPNGDGGTDDYVYYQEAPGAHDRLLTTSIFSNHMGPWQYVTVGVTGVNSIIGVGLYNNL